jgi:hypothetical protein
MTSTTGSHGAKVSPYVAPLTRYERGTDVLHNEQADEYARTTRYLMARGLTEPIGTDHSRSARLIRHEMADRGAMLREEASGADIRRAWHAIAYPDAYAPQEAPTARPVVLSGALLPETDPRDLFAMTAADRVLWELEREANRILREAGDDIVRTDHRDKLTRRMQVSPDRVAFRGVQRFKVRHATSHVAKRTSWRYVPLSDGVDAMDCIACGEFAAFETTELGTVQLRRSARYLIVGHGKARRMADRNERRRNVRKVTSPRTVGAGKRGRSVSPLNATDRAIRKRWADVTPEVRSVAEHVVNVLLSSVPTDTSFTLSDGTPHEVGPMAVTPSVSVSVIGHGTVRVVGGVAMTVQSLARRVALMGEPVTLDL